MKITYLLVAIVSLVTVGCSHFSHEIIPNSPPSGASIKVSLLCPNENDRSQSFAHVYHFPNTYRSDMDENGTLLKKADVKTIDHQDLMTLFRQVQQYVDNYKVEDVKLNLETQALLDVNYAEGGNKVEIYKVINLPLDQNSREITELISTCRRYAEKYK